MTSQRFLLLSLKYKRIEKRLDWVEYENFGYCPSNSHPLNTYFEKLMSDRCLIRDELILGGFKLNDDELTWSKQC